MLALLEFSVWFDAAAAAGCKLQHNIKRIGARVLKRDTQYAGEGELKANQIVDQTF